MSHYLSAIKIYRWFFSICSLTPPPPTTNRQWSKIKLGILFSIYIIFCFGIFFGVTVYTYYFYGILKRSETIANSDTLSKVMGYLSTISSGVVYTVIILQIFMKFKYYKDIIHFIEDLENNIPVVNVKWYTIHWRIFKVCGLSLLILLILLIYVNHKLLPTIMAPKQRALIIILSSAMQMKCCEYGMYIRITSEFLERLHGSLERTRDDIESFTLVGRTVPWPLLWQIIKNQMLVSRIWLLVKKIEYYFGWSILCLFFYNTVCVLTVVNWAYVMRKSDNHTITPYYRVIYMGTLLGNIFIVCILAEKCIEKYQKLSLLIHSFNLTFEDRPLLMRIREYSLQLQHQKLIFSCHGYYDINLGSFGKLLLAITAYVVILIQFQLEVTSIDSSLSSQSVFG